MSAVIARLVNAVQPAPTTRPREITITGSRYRFVNGVVQYLSGTEWVTSAWNDREGIVSLAAGNTAGSIAAIVDLINHPTETVPAPTPEPTVVLEMPKDVAVSLLSILGKVGGDRATTYRGDTEDVLNALYHAGIEPVYSRFKLNGYAYGSTISGSLEGAAR